MADLDLGAALDAIVADLAAAFPEFSTVEAEDENRTELPVPALLVQVSDLEPDPESDASDGRLPVLVHIEARVVLGYRTPKVRREVMKAAGAVAARAHNTRFGIEWGAAEVVAIEPDEFAPQADQLDLWRVEWVHQADLGTSLIIDDGTIPTQVLVSWVPDIGIPHEPDYQRVDTMIEVDE